MAGKKPLDQEINTFESLKESLLVDHEGEWAVVQKDRLVGVFNSYEDALNQGYKECKAQEFLVRQILRIENPIHYFHGVVL